MPTPPADAWTPLHFAHQELEAVSPHMMQLQGCVDELVAQKFELVQTSLEHTAK
jgi:hypothetical protein